MTRKNSEAVKRKKVIRIKTSKIVILVVTWHCQVNGCMI
ncbi:hypothetical protein JOC47_002851 [Halanaerobacter jeridensis]|uniref:Uncharacterized protein n=1 Tax=Halanaerobacter jeridensis TaxID=706427 RepID=A0A938XR14_9FIRM|nr:hypothetical protein [Halanaerobacter jeridensis]